MSGVAAEPLVRKTVTVLFCDVSGFTSMGERVEPETMRRVMMRYFDEMRGVLERHGGTVEKFIGDAVMAVFGVPVLHEDDALRAVRAADEMRSALMVLNDELGSRWGVRLDIRIGINTGEVVVGGTDSDQTIATGDVVNVAARLQQAAEPGEILFGRDTYRLVRDQISAGPLQAFSLKGKSERVAPWRLGHVHERASGMLRRLDAPFVGRESERARLDDAYGRAVEEETCRLAVIVGAAGLGKTRLAREFASRLLAAQVLQGRCLPYGDGITFWPVMEIIREAAEIVGEDSTADAREKVTRLLPSGGDSVRAAEGVWSTIGLSDQGVRAEESFWALRRLFESMARARPLVLVFEDLHSAEPTLLDLIEYLVGWSKGSPILLLGLGRPELLEERPSWGADAIVLEPLDTVETVTVATNVLGGGVLDSAIAARIADAAGGNPLFAEEVVRMLKDDGDLVPSEGGWTLRAGAELRVPPSISALLSARLDRLEPDERTVLQCASVIGKEFWWSSVIELAPPPLRERVGPQLHSLVRKRLIEPAGSAALMDEDAFRFSHILVRDAAYASLPKSRRAELHEEFASWASQRMGNRLTEVEEILGYHYEQAYVAREGLGPVDERARELADRASSLLASAGRRALERWDMHAAAKLLRRAEHLANDEPTAARLRCDLGLALMESGELVEADELLSSAIDSASHLGEVGLASDAAVVRAYVRFRTDATWAIEETRSVADESIRVFGLLHDNHGLARALRLLSLTHSWHCHWEAMADSLRSALGHAEKAGDESERGAILVWLVTALYYGPLRAPEAIRQCEEVMQSAAGNRIVQGPTACHLAGLLAMTGRFDEAREWGSRGMTILAELGLNQRLAGGRVRLADVELLAGEPKAAEHELMTAFDALESSGDRSGAIAIAADLAHVLYVQGRFAEAERWAALGRNVLESNDVMTRVVGLAIDARLAAHANRHVEAEALARRAVEISAPTDALNVRAAALLALAEVLRAVQSHAEARSATETAVGLYERKGNVAAAAQVHASRVSAAASA
jgi:class 3 adenylate cyclase/tetratricopeptide (TPR) repeat protein